MARILVPPTKPPSEEDDQPVDYPGTRGRMYVKSSAPAPSKQTKAQKKALKDAEKEAERVAAAQAAAEQAAAEEAAKLAAANADHADESKVKDPTVARDAAAGDPPPPADAPDERPSDNASTEVWHAYARSKGKTEKDLDGLGRNAIRDLFPAPSSLI